MRSRAARRGSAVVAVAAALLAAACSSGGGSAASSTQASGSAQASGASSGSVGSTITVQGLIGVTDFGTGASKAAAARFAQANASGEIPGGRKINYLGYLDDGATPDTDLTAVRQIIDQNHVFGIVPAMTSWLQSASVYIDQKQVPTIGWGVASGFCPTGDYSSDYLFGFNGCLVPSSPQYQIQTAPLTAKLIPGGAAGKSVAIIGANDAAQSSGVQSSITSFTAAGFKVVYAKTPIPPLPAVVSDFSPYVQSLMAADNGKPPSLIDMTLDPSDAFPLGAALRQAGYTGLISQTTYAPQLAKAAKSMLADSTFATTEATNLPAMKSIVATLTEAGVNPIGEPELVGYFAADMFVKILQAVGPDLTPEAFRQAAANFTYQIPGVVGPSSYPAGFQVGPSCGEILSSDGTKWTIVQPYSCYADVLKKNGSSWSPVPYPSGVS
jgi:branched-chain amino acid transport system substrate-binding protein